LPAASQAHNSCQSTTIHQLANGCLLDGQGPTLHRKSIQAVSRWLTFDGYRVPCLRWCYARRPLLFLRLHIGFTLISTSALWTHWSSWRNPYRFPQACRICSNDCCSNVIFYFTSVSRRSWPSSHATFLCRAACQRCSYCTGLRYSSDECRRRQL
jgi:hypothetical protein